MPEHGYIDRYSGGGFRALACLTGLTLCHGRGATIFDTDDAAYIDLVGGYGVAAIGHGHPAVAEALSRQASQLSCVPYFHRPLDD